MNCAEFKKNISKYILGRLGPELREAFEEHYFGCQECFQQLELKDALATIIRDEGVEGILGQTPEVDKVDALLEYADAAERLGDDEEAEKLRDKASKLGHDSLSVSINNGEEETILLIGEDIVINVPKLPGLFVKRDNKILIDEEIEEFSLGFSDEEPIKTLYEDEKIVIRFEKGVYQSKLIFSPKKKTNG